MDEEVAMSGLRPALFDPIEIQAHYEDLSLVEIDRLIDLASGGA